jgi:hypothetical protein
MKGSARLDPSRVRRQTLTFGIERVASAKALVPDPVTAIQGEIKTKRLAVGEGVEPSSSSSKPEALPVTPSHIETNFVVLEFEPRTLR